MAKKKIKKSLTAQFFESKAGVMQNIYYYVIGVMMMIMAIYGIVGLDNLSSFFETFVVANLCIFNLIIVYYTVLKSDTYASISIALVMINALFVVKGISTSAFTNISVIIMLFGTCFIFGKHLLGGKKC